MTVRAAVIGCVEFSRHMLEVLLRMPEISVEAVVTRAASAANADFASLVEPANVAGVPVCVVEAGSREDIAAFLRERHVQLGFCVGWSSLLSREIIDLCPRGMIGFHPSALPDNRGRHPLIWALALGLERTAATFLLLDEGADTGSILDQTPVPIRADDDARVLYDRVVDVARERLGVFLPAYLEGTLVPTPQGPASGNAWRKRSPLDGDIDWRMGFDAIDCLVRALRPPYPGATSSLGGRRFAVWQVAPGPAAPANIEPGKVLAISGGEVVVKCWRGSVRVLEHELPASIAAGDYLL